MLHVDPRYPAPQGDASVVDLVRAHPFATVISWGEGEPAVSHLPVLGDVENGRLVRLRTHLARINPHAARLIAGAPVLVIFQGADAYVSASWYTQPLKRAPTWNYAVAHVAGRVEPLDDMGDIDRVLDETAALGEPGVPQPWVPADYDPERRAMLRPAILVFAVAVERVDAKFKLHQNNAMVERLRVIDGLRARGDAASLVVADMMRDAIAAETG